VVDNQSTVEIHVLQGEREIAKGNRSLGRFELIGIPPAPRGVPQIEVSFEIDADGIVQVSARDKATGLEQNMRVTPSSGLSPGEIANLIAEAQRNAEKDRQLKELILLQSRLDGLLQNTQRSFGEFGWMLSDEEQNYVRETLNGAKEVLNVQDIEVVKQWLEALEQAAQIITNALFNMPAGDTPPPETGGVKMLTE